MEEGRRFDRYVVRGLLGRGGMAEVWLAEHGVLGTRVALKLLLGVPTAVQRARLVREGQVQASLQHPNVVRVLDVLEVDGQTALVMDAVAGPSLHEVLRQGPLPLLRVEQLLGGIVAGLEAAHARGVIHRDLKPGNVLLADGDVPKITDFGLAAVLDSGERLTHAGTGFGTPSYLAPEQADDARAADRRSDVFALAALTYELLVGAPPAEGPALSVLHRMAHGRWTPAGERVPGLPPRVDAALRHALAPDPGRRTPTAAVFFAELCGASASAARSSAEASGPASAPPPSQPSTYRVLVGRGPEVDGLAERLRSRGGVATVVGPPGVGKTRLAAEVVARWAEARGPGAHAWVDLSPVSDVEGLEQQVTAALADPDPAPVAARLARRGAFLLVLDNLEHLTGDLRAWVEAVAAAAPSLRILGTSREALALPREEVTELAPLPTPDDDPFGSAAWRILESAAPRGALDGVPEALAVRLLQLLDGLPLCLELAAARLEVLGPQDLVDRLAEPTRVLRVPGAEGRHDALAATLRWSWSLLRPDEQRALARLSVFRGSFGVAEAEALLGQTGLTEPLDALHGLVRRHLVRRERARFRLLRSIRDFAAQALGDQGPSARRAHAAVLLPTAEGLRRGPVVPATLARLRALAPEMEAVAASPDVADDDAVAAAAALASAWHDAGVPRTLLRVTGLGLDRCRADHPERHGLLLSRSLAHRRCADFAAAAADLRACEALATDDRQRATTALHAADLAVESDRDDDARRGYALALPLARAAGVRHLQVSACTALATLSADREEARRWLAEAEAAIPEGDALSRLRWAKGAGWVALTADDFAEAEPRYQEVRALARDVGDRRTEGYATGQLGGCAEGAGRLADAEAAYRFAAVRFAEDGDPVYAAYYEGAAARTLARRGRWDEAEAAWAVAAERPGRWAEACRRWLAVARARTRPQPCPAPALQWLFDALEARRSGDRAAVRAALARRAARSGSTDADERLREQLAAELAEEAGAWRIAQDGAWFETPEGARTSLERHPANARILAHLARSGDGVADAAALAAAGWPGERIVPAAAANRVRVALSALRRAGLEPLIERHGGGWRLAAGIPVQLSR